MDDKMRLEHQEDAVIVPMDDSRKDLQMMEKRIVHKYDKHVLPLVWVLFILSYLDRGNIGNAKTAGAQKDLGLSSNQWSWVLLSFYITYTCLEWLVLCWKLLPPRVWAAICCFGWGLLAMMSGLVHNMGGLVACRALLAVFEAGFGAGVPYYLSLCYKRRELGTRLAILLGSSPIANCIAGAMAYGIMQAKTDYDHWRLIFLIEGAPTVVMAPITYFFLMNHPSTAKFLNTEERQLAVDRMETRDNTAGTHKLSKKQLLAGISDYKNWAHAIMHFCCNYSFAALSNFLPTIINEMGYSSIHAQGLTAPPYLGAFIASIIVAVASDRYGSRGILLSASAAVACVGYVLLCTQTGTAARYVAVWLASCGIFPALAINMTWMLNNNAGETKKGVGMSILAIVGQSSSFVASKVFPSQDGPYYITGCAIGAGLSGLIVPTGLVLHFAYTASNRRKERESGPHEEVDGPIDVSDTGERHKDFRLMT